MCIRDSIYACWKAGAAVAHMHMRDDVGNGTMDVNKFRETVELLRKNHPECDIVLNMTTSGDLNATEETRQIHLKELRPEMGSYDCGSMNWMNSGLFINSPKFLEELGKNMQEWNVKPEIEAFDPGMIANAAYYQMCIRDRINPHDLAGRRSGRERQPNGDAYQDITGDAAQKGVRKAQAAFGHSRTHRRSSQRPGKGRKLMAVHLSLIPI